MKLDNFYYLEYSEYCLDLSCYIHNVSTDASFGLPQVFIIELWSCTEHQTEHFIYPMEEDCSNPVNQNWGWICNKV